MQEYGSLRRPWLKVFFGAFFTYQILYWSWEKMRTDEVIAQKTKEVQELEAQVEQLQKAKEEGSKARDAKNSPKKRSWWG